MAEPRWPTTSAVATEPDIAPPPGAAPTPGPVPEMDKREQQAALVRLIIVVTAGLVVAALYGALDTVLVVLGLILMIVLHEFGHFIMAKRAGMKVTEFFVGFGPRVWSIQRGETTYGVKALPLGGYCKIIGMTNAEKVDPADEARLREAELRDKGTAVGGVLPDHRHDQRRESGPGRRGTRLP